MSDINKPNIFPALTCLNSILKIWTDEIAKLEKKQNLKDFCLAWAALWDQYEEIDKKRKELLQLFDTLNEEILPKAFEDAGIDKIAIPELARSFYPLLKYSASIKDNSAALNWLRQNGMEGLITETVNRNTLAATLKDRLLNENKDPPESMSLTSYKIVGSSKYTPKGK